MGIHIFIYAPGGVENRLNQQFLVFNRLLRLCRSTGFLKKIPEFLVWKGPPVKSMGGEYLGRLPRLGIKALQQLLQSKKHDYYRFIYWDREYSIGFEEYIQLAGPDGTTLEVPCNFYMETALSDLYGDVSMEVFTHHARLFNDYFVGNEEWIRENQEKLKFILNDLINRKEIRKIDVGNEPGITANMLEAIYIFRRHIRDFYSDLISLPRELLSRIDEYVQKGIKRIKVDDLERKPSEPPPSTLTREELLKLQRTLTPYNIDTFIVRTMDEVDAFQEHITEYMAQEAVFQAGSIVIYNKDFSPLTKLFENILKQLSIGFYDGLPKYDQLERDFENALKKVKFKID